jgi:phosphatidylserine decarboxylase
MTAKLILQYLLPHRLLSRVVYHATRWRWRPWKDFLIGQVVSRYGVDLGEAVEPDRRAYPSFNAFFTRALRPGARRTGAQAAVLAAPCDGRISQCGTIDGERLLQAKGRDYTVTELLADRAVAGAYDNGAFVTLYLAPRDYHRVHMPLAGELIGTVHVPGRLFSVAPFTVASIPRLFARNERLVCHFAGERGPFAVVLVGAMLVSAIDTVWSGSETPPYAGAVERRDYRGRGIRLEQGAELGRFNMGSTVIVLVPPGRVQLDRTLAPGHPTVVGAALGTLTG